MRSSLYLSLLFLLGCAGVPLPTGAQPLTNGQNVTLTGKDAILFRQKTTCGTTEPGVTYYGMWEGRAYSRVPGEKDKHLFNVVGINVRQCSRQDDAERGYGFRSVSNEIMVYLDPETNEVMDVWTNPWTGEEVDVVHVANDPVNMRGYAYERGSDGKETSTTLRKYGDVAVTSYEIPLFYKNPLGSDYQAYVGGAYHAMEIFNTYYAADEVLDSKVTAIGQSNISWTRTAQWLPWMAMGDKVGIMIFNATGYSTLDKREVWPNLVAVLNDRYPDYWAPPVLDDPRPNETSWTVFEKYMAGKEKLGVTGKKRE